MLKHEFYTNEDGVKMCCFPDFGKYQCYVKKGFVTYDDNKNPLSLKEDKNGNLEWVSIPNPYRVDNNPFRKEKAEKGYFFNTFDGYPQDMVHALKDGIGHCMQSNTMFGGIFEVNYIFDEKIGEQFRQLTLDGWKNAKFGFGFELPSYGYGKDPYFGRNGSFIHAIAPLSNLFTTEQEAWAMAKDYVTMACGIVDKYGHLFRPSVRLENESDEERDTRISKDIEEAKNVGLDINIVRHICRLMNFSDGVNKERVDYFRGGEALNVVQIVAEE